MLGFQVALVFEQEVVHEPELALAARRFRGERGLQGVRMHFFLREMAEDHAQPAGEMLQHQLHGRRGLLANGTLEITVFDERDGGVHCPERLIDLAHRYRQLKPLMLVHADSIVIASV